MNWVNLKNAILYVICSIIVALVIVEIILRLIPPLFNE